ncbi:MAG: cobalamin biosynthesis protein [Psychrobium sp.]|nr:cobalamin biosynthesis protein [Psychrobium sp.]
MSALSQQLILSDFSLRLLTLLIVLIIERYVSLPASYHPATLFRYLAMQLAKKVNQRTAPQQIGAGALAMTLLLTLSLGACATLLYFASSAWFFEGVILFFALSSRQLISQCGLIITSLTRQHKVLAREQLALLCVRDHQTLSTMGIVKACIEGLLQRLAQTYFNVIFAYILLGIYGLVMSVCISSLAQCWNPKKIKYRHFGKLTSSLSALINLPNHLLLCLNIALLYGFKHLNKQTFTDAKQWHRFGNGLLLSTTANALQRQLGGAVIYDQIKIKRPSLGYSQTPNLDDLVHVKRMCLQLRHSYLAFVVITLLSSLIISNI